MKWLTGDVNWRDYGGKWYKRVDPSTIRVVEFNNWDELDSSAVPLYGQYNVVAGDVHLNDPNKGSALRSCGWRQELDGTIISDAGDIVAGPGYEHYDLVITEALWGYGAHSHVVDESGNNAYALLNAVGVYRPNAHLKGGV